MEITQQQNSFFFIAAQIIWWGMGISLFYDIAESILSWPHLVVVSLYSSLMIASTWFGVRVMFVLSMITLPALLSLMYFSFVQPLSGDTLWALWSRMLTAKSVEYVSWLLLLTGSFASVAHSRTANHKTGHYFHLTSAIALAGFVGGLSLMFFAGLNSVIASTQTDIVLILAQQGSNIVWVMGLAKSPVKGNSTHSVTRLSKTSLRWLLLFVGTLGAIFYDWLSHSQYMMGWLQYPSVFLPPLVMMLIWK